MQSRNRLTLAAIIVAGAGSLLVTEAAFFKEYISGLEWPEPTIVTPGESTSQPPSDAIVLFDGTDLSQWHNGEKWTVENGYAQVKGADIRSKQSFGDIQLHIEWATPEEVKGSSQGRGNSGVFLMDRYEVQVLDSFDNKTYFDGQAGAIYKQKPPMVNACKGPGEWQTYDIIFEAPRFDEAGKVTRPAHLTVLHNGVLIQNHTELLGNTNYASPPSYVPHPEKLPIRLQNHGNPIRYRNIWVRELKDIKPANADSHFPSAEALDPAQYRKPQRKPAKPKADEPKPVDKKPAPEPK